MPYVKGLPSFRVSKVSLIILAILAFGSACYSAWWLRPLARDGSRYAIQLLNLSSPYFDDIRYSHGLFQLPVVLLANISHDFSPLTLTRIYFLSLVLPVFMFLIYQLFLADRLFKLIVPATILLIGYIPGNSFFINSIFETTFFFYLMFLCMQNDRSSGFYLFGLFSALGHTSILSGFLILMGLMIYESAVEKKKLRRDYFFYLVILSVISILLTVKTIAQAPLSAGNFFGVITDYLKGIGSPKTFTTSLSLLFSGILISSLVRERSQIVLRILLGIMACGLILNSPEIISIHSNAFDYRVFTLMMILLVLILLWFDLKVWRIEFDSFTLLSLLIVGSVYIYQDLRIGQEFKRVFSEIKKINSTSGCHLIEVPRDIRRYTSEMAFPAYKILIDNRFDLNYLLFTRIAEQTDPCREFQISPDGQAQFHLGHGVFFWMSQKGHFTLPEFARTNQ